MFQISIGEPARFKSEYQTGRQRPLIVVYYGKQPIVSFDLGKGGTFAGLGEIPHELLFATE